MVGFHCARSTGQTRPALPGTHLGEPDVRYAPPSRRAAGLLAAGSIGLSTALLSVPGVASAATTSYTFSTDASASVDQPGVDQISIVTDGDCTIAWVLDGAAGGAGRGTVPTTGSAGGHLTATTDAFDGDTFSLYPGNKGGNATSSQVGPGGTNDSSYPSDGTDGSGNTPAVYGGGGGAASIVEDGNGDPLLGAFGGDGAGADELNNGAGGLDGTYFDHSGGVHTASTVTGNGVISGTVTCTAADPVAPGAPTLADWVEVGDGTATFQFTPGDEGDAHPVSYEYQLDGGSWTPFDVSFTGSDDLTGTLSRLTNLHTYKLVVRATSAAGTSAASAQVTFQPYRRVAAPASVTAAVGVTSIRISWTPPADATGVDRYEAFATPWGAQSNSETVSCTTADAKANACTVAVKPGRAYGFGVHGIDAAGNGGDGIFGQDATAVVPASATPATLPKASAPLTSSDTDGAVTAGQQVTLSGKGFLPGSTVELIVYSSPVKLGTATVSADGTFSATVTVPKDLEDGVHHLVASGVDADGNVRNLVVEVTVSGGTAVLAFTGFEPLPYLAGGLLAIAAGTGLLLAGRRRAQ